MKPSSKRPRGAQPHAAPPPDTPSPKPCDPAPAPPTIAEIASHHLAFLRERLAQLRVGTEDLDDATHEVLLDVWKSLPSYDPAHPAGLKAWLARIAHRYSLRHRAQAAQKRARFVPISPELPATVDPSPRVDVLTEQSERAKELLRALPEKRRDVLLAHDVDGMTLDEIAEALSIPRGTVASRLRRAREEVTSANMRVEASRRRRGFCVPFFLRRVERRGLAAQADEGAGSAFPTWPRLSGLACRASALFRRAGRSLAVIAVAAVLPCEAASLPAPEVPRCGLCTSGLIHEAGGPAASALERTTSAPSALALLPEPRQAVTAQVAASASGGSMKPPPVATSAPMIHTAPRSRSVAPREAAGDEAFERRLVEEARAAVRKGDAARAVESLDLRAQRFPVGPFARQAEALGEAAQSAQSAHAAHAAHER